MPVPRDDKGRVLPGGALNPGGRAGKRGRAWNERLSELSHDGELMLQGLVDIAKDKNHRDRLKALVYLSERFLGPLSKQHEDLEADPFEALSDDQVEKLAAEVFRRRTDETEVCAVPAGGGAVVPGAEAGQGD